MMFNLFSLLPQLSGFGLRFNFVSLGERGEFGGLLAILKFCGPETFIVGAAGCCGQSGSLCCASGHQEPDQDSAVSYGEA